MNRATRRKLRYYEHIYWEARIAATTKERKLRALGLAFQMGWLGEGGEIITIAI